MNNRLDKELCEARFAARGAASSATRYLHSTSCASWSVRSNASDAASYAASAAARNAASAASAAARNAARAASYATSFASERKKQVEMILKAL